MKRFLIFSAIFLFNYTLIAQPINKPTYSSLIEAAEEQLELQDYYNALEKYEAAYDESEDKELRPIIAKLHFLLRDYSRAERAYNRILRNDKENKYAAERYTFGRILKMNADYEAAIEELQKFVTFTDNDSLKELARNEITGAQMAIDMPDAKKGVTVENVGRKVNSSFSEYSPALSGDGNTLYYIAFDAKEVIIVDDKNVNYHSKIYTSKKGEKEWEKPEELEEKINRPGVHATHVSLSKDGRRMFFTRGALGGNVLADSKIYMSELGDDGWMGPNAVEGVNGNYVAKQPVAGELFGNEVLFFSSDMPGGYGGFDIYYATYKGGGIYGDPVNLGAKINSLGNDETPFYHDGTLYFSSDGHPGLGGFDIFYSAWNGSVWSDPTNMGKSYNTSLDELYFSIDEEGYKGFLTSNRPGGRSLKSKTCCDDIFEFNIARVYADLVVGVFTESKQVLKSATVQVVETLDATVGKPQSKKNDKGNRFDFGLDLDKPYRIIVSHDKYFPDSIEFNTLGIKESKTFEHRFFLKPKPEEPEYDTITIENPIVLENILYDFDDDRIRGDAESDLQVVYELIQEYPEMIIELSSHTDYRGDDDYNEELSQRRAESARRWLVRKEIPRNRIQAKGYGENQPKTVSEKEAAGHEFLNPGDVLTQEFIDALADEDQKEVAHEINRRTEFKIIEGPTSIIIKRTRLKKKQK